MGQQQLLLIALGIVIVGIAVVLGMNAYSQTSVKSNYDAVLQDVLRIAIDAQTWKTKPEFFGGQEDSRKLDKDDFTGAKFPAWGYAQPLIGSGSTGDGSCYTNMNGVYDIALAGDDGLLITGASAQHSNQAQVFVNGTLEPNLFLGSSASGPDPGDLCIGGADVLGGGECTIEAVTSCEAGS